MSSFARVQNICDWFVPLNPYEADPKKGAVSILEMEDENFCEGNELEPLFCFAISAKRYALFNLDRNGKPDDPQGFGARPGTLSPRRTETKKKPAANATAASGLGKRTFGSRSSRRRLATSRARSITHFAAK